MINSTTHDDYGRKAGGYLALMEKFATFFGLKLGFLIFSGTEQLSISLQGKDTTVQESVNAAELAVRYLERLRQDNSFEEFYSQTLEASKDLTCPPTLDDHQESQVMLVLTVMSSILHKLTTEGNTLRLWTC